MSSKIKRRKKNKKTKKKQKQIKKKEKKNKKKKITTLFLETRARSEGYMAKVFKARCPKPTGWESPTLCSLQGWMGEVWQVIGAGVSKSFEVQGET